MSDTLEGGRIVLADDAPDVDLHILVLQNLGLQLDNHPIMGRIVTASTDLGPKLVNKPVLREYPALVCKQQDYMDFMEKFLDAPVELQVGILDLFYQPLDSPMGGQLLEPAQLLFMLGALEDFKVIHQLLCILMTNGHQYKGTCTALALLGTKFGHSCDPNIGYTSNGCTDGALEYILLRPTKKGDMLCFSYLADLLDTPTMERRKLLMETKSFWCDCERCNGPDYCRNVPCPTCSQLIPCQYTHETFEAYWQCPNCGILESDPLILAESRISEELETIEVSIQARKDFSTTPEYSPASLSKLVEKCQSELSMTHYLTMKALRLQFTTLTTLAYVEIKRLTVRGMSIHHSKVHGLFRESGVVGYRLVLACECVAAKCSGCLSDPSDLKPRHAPNFDRALVIEHISDNLLRIPSSWWPPLTVTMTRRYMPLLKARFGAKVAKIESIILDDWEERTCLECGTYWDAFAGRRSSR